MAVLLRSVQPRKAMDGLRPDFKLGKLPAAGLRLVCYIRNGVVSMRKLVLLPVGALLALGFLLPGQDGPNKDVGETVARPSRPSSDPVEVQQPKIPSRLSKKDKIDYSQQPDFKVDTSVVNVDVAVL